ncbi:MAG: undecaprenyldiphospho-muramoylpentapeptide beta-N-acetylglucosaminyltransferase [Candidatus Schekmanbacteria bacterium RBG_13_48_7]|uniref:UDP-N-acetylglucosamine--N-acetylmuramyl-(pentapeptide) pyrophosphoryl-undecaprenol N-acetylglucosamine transferase n=1 Tax=Candidatus Schekmanbacteria bacterium RBG_13_48_7 TaxID=1817878 RepID=A0A1F7RP82_9BACT|nr:MAG: undecaprenyldiphospho-muramoylpentapeptide beta-N-acetylglucosaminyltransferase [Candidatus Schekmanbacteria bacterium RBG_13_48_7]
MTKKVQNFVIVCGGTGGHIYPGLAVASGIRKKFKEASIHFIGTYNRMESKIIPETGYPFYGISVEGIQRRMDWVGIKKNVKSLLLLVSGIPLWQSLRILSKIKPQAVFATGGYFSGPVIFASYILKIPCISLEPNVVPGLANRLAAPFLKKIIITHQESSIYFRRKDKCVKIGTPVRPEIFATNRNEALKNFHLDPDRITILIMGGSLGAKNINDSIQELLRMIKNNENHLKEKIQIIHSIGKRHYQDYIEYLVDTGEINYQPLEYIEHMDQLLPAVDLFIGRSGATSIAEATSLGIPMILIPWRGVNQAANAEVLAKNGAAELIYDDELTSGKLYQFITDFVIHPQKREQMVQNSQQQGNPNAAEEIADLLIQISNK